MTTPSLETTGAGSRTQWSLAVTVQSISKDSFVFGIAIQRGDAVAPAAHEPDSRRAGELAGNLAAGDQPKLILSAHHRPLIGIDRKRRDTMGGIIRLPFVE